LEAKLSIDRDNFIFVYGIDVSLCRQLNNWFGLGINVGIKKDFEVKKDNIRLNNLDEHKWT
jgi:hypothetical protein